MVMLALGQIAAVSGWLIFIPKNEIAPHLPKRYFLPTTLGVLLFNAGTIFFAVAMEKSQASLVSPLSNLYVVVLVFFSAVYLKEKIRLIQMAGILLVLFGTIFVFIIQPEVKPSIINQTNFINISPSPGDTFPIAVQTPTNELPPNKKEKAIVRKIIDGDSIELIDGRQVRYIGIDTPEFGKGNKPDECFASESAHINKQLVEKQIIEMEKDITETDNYHRLLRYVWVEGVFVNEFLVRQGYAKSMPIAPDTKYSQIFFKAEKEARENKLGLWKNCYR